MHLLSFSLCEGEISPSTQRPKRKPKRKKMAQIQCFILLLVAMGCVLMTPANALDHIVGGSFGWSSPKNTSFYQEWAKPRTFGVSDRLVFMYRTGVHNILQVNEKEFKECTQDHAIAMEYKGPTIIELPKPGKYYYYCGVGLHCEAGQKLSITVVKGPGSSGAPFNGDDGTGHAAPAPTKSSANSIGNFGLVCGLLYSLVSMLLI